MVLYLLKLSVSVYYDFHGYRQFWQQKVQTGILVAQNLWLYALSQGRLWRKNKPSKDRWQKDIFSTAFLKELFWGRNYQTYLFTHSVCLFVHLPVSKFACLFISLFVCQSIWLFNTSSFCLYVCSFNQLSFQLWVYFFPLSLCLLFCHFIL